MINFTVGPVQAFDETLQIGAEQVPYFRTPEFSQLMLECERDLKRLAHAPADARAVFMTGSGTASMEAAVMNALTERDRVLVVNGGSFGERFVQLCRLHRIEHVELKLEAGCALGAQDLERHVGKGLTALLINMHETSTGVLYDMPMVAEFCRHEGLFLIVDCISAFLADPFDMQALGADIMITGSQKALACPPGVSMLVLSSRAIERIMSQECGCMYLDLKSALRNAERGQTPFTPAVGTLRQIHRRLQAVCAAGGAESEIARVRRLAEYFRSRLDKLPFTLFAQTPSNAVTALESCTGEAGVVFNRLKDEYGIWVCPNGGPLRDKVFRVGHIGALCEADYDKLFEALFDLQKRGLI